MYKKGGCSKSLCTVKGTMDPEFQSPRYLILNKKYVYY